MPNCNKIVLTEPCGDSARSMSTARIIVEGDLASVRVLGEYSCMLESTKAMPLVVPKSHGFGPCLDSDGYFFLCDYLPIDHRRPDPVKPAHRISGLHRKSVSPTSQFGFHVTPYDGKLLLQVEWDSSWVSFYTKLLRGNLRIDSCAYFAHHEMTLGMWRVSQHEMDGEEYRDEYYKHFKPDEPVEDCDDRNRLYATKERIMYAAHVPGSEARAEALEDMSFLIAKFVKQ
ncbi:hypothetical protein F5B21DRAFT_516178 [Xylaria acuta]|nr:hypothetical protein F5B21DRAFT_516178 [Xylaria acuta]